MSDYDVGYGKPPKSGQVRKGEVRNPYGRAGKKQTAQSATAEAALLEKIDSETVVVDNRAMTRRESHIRAQYVSALKGKANAIRFIDRLSQRCDSEGIAGGALALPCGSPGGWNAKDAIAQYEKRRERDWRNARRRSQRAKMRSDRNQPLPLKQDWEILADLENETVERDGRMISMLEVRLRLYKAFAAKGNRAAQEVIARIQNAPKGTAQRRPAVLLVPAPMSLEEWSAMAERQQAKFREPLEMEETDKR